MGASNVSLFVLKATKRWSNGMKTAELLYSHCFIYMRLSSTVEVGESQVSNKVHYLANLMASKMCFIIALAVWLELSLNIKLAIPRLDKMNLRTFSFMFANIVIPQPNEIILFLMSE